MSTTFDEIFSSIENKNVADNTRKTISDKSYEINSVTKRDFEIFYPDTRKKINDTLVAPFRYICLIEIVRNGVVEAARTGFLIGPRTVLTAGHCIWNEDIDDFEDRSNIIVYPGRNGLSKPFGSSRVSNLFVRDFFNNSYEGTQYDYGIIELKDPIGNKSGFWNIGYGNSANDSIGTSVLPKNLPKNAKDLNLNLSGYPSDKGGYEQWFSYNNGTRIKEGLLMYKNDTFEGHSGSPVWIKRDPSMGGRVLVGIHIRGRFDNKDDNGAVLIDDDVRAFILRNLK